MPDTEIHGPGTEKDLSNGSANMAEKSLAAQSFSGRLRSLFFVPAYLNAKEASDEEKRDDKEDKLTALQRLQLAFYMLKPWAKIALPALVLVVAVTAGALIFVAFHSDVKLEANIIDLYNNDTIMENYQKLGNQYLDYLVENFGIKPKQAEEVLSGEGAWKFYCLKVGFKNNHKYPIDINLLKIYDNGKENVWLCSSLGGSIGIPAKYQEIEQASVEVLVNSKNMNIEQVLRAVERLNVEVEYSRTIGYDEKGRLLPDEDEHVLDETPKIYAQLKGTQ